MTVVWKAPDNVVALLNDVIFKHHSPRLSEARFAVAFSDAKPFVRNKFNWGKVIKFTNFNKLWQNDPKDFSIVISADVWQDVLKQDQHEPYLDLQLTRCGVEYEPEFVFENKRKKPVKDSWGRIKYTNKVRMDDNDNPKWKVDSLDLEIYFSNVIRYGLWMQSFLEDDDTWLEKVVSKETT